MPGETPPAAVPNLPTSPSVGSAHVDPQKSAATAPVSSGGELVLLIKANSDTWAEVTDDTKRVRVQRLLKAGEEQSFNGASSFSVVLGNAMAAQVFVRGQPVDLMARSKNNVARFDVK
jgi:cytoskeleton protein RodZ